MIISKKNHHEICKYLFQEGVLYAKKDYNLEKHPLINVPNLGVIKLMQSFKSREYVRETFAWMHYYRYLTNDGIEFLRTFLNLPSKIVLATLKKSTKAPSHPFGSGPPGDRPRGPPRFEGDRPRFGDRDGYYRGPRGSGEKGGAPPEFQPSFRGTGGRPGFGRGGGGYGQSSAPALEYSSSLSFHCPFSQIFFCSYLFLVFVFKDSKRTTFFLYGSNRTNLIHPSTLYIIAFVPIVVVQ